MAERKVRATLRKHEALYRWHSFLCICPRYVDGGIVAFERIERKGEFHTRLADSSYWKWFYRLPVPHCHL